MIMKQNILIGLLIPAFANKVASMRPQRSAGENSLALGPCSMRSIAVFASGAFPRSFLGSIVSADYPDYKYFT